jgi:hypothetical protein
MTETTRYEDWTNDELKERLDVIHGTEPKSPVEQQKLNLEKAHIAFELGCRVAPPVGGHASEHKRKHHLFGSKR